MSDPSNGAARRAPRTDELVAAALDLRRWALAVLAARRPAPDGLLRSAARAPADAWRVFLGVERCALPLKEALAAGGAPDRLPPAARQVRERRATVELQRVLSARAQIRAIGALAEEHGWRVVVLKGGVPVAEGRRGVDVADVDVLLEERDAHRLAARLDAGEHRAASGGISHHLAQRVAEGSVPVEVHLSLETIASRGIGDVWSGVRPLAGSPGLLRLAPADHLAYLVTHSVAQHPWRQGSLRDILLVADGLGECGPEERDQVERALLEQRRGRAMAALLAMADAVANGAVPGDAFEGVAAANYALHAGPAPWAPGEQLRAIRGLALFAAVRRGPEVPAFLRKGATIGRHRPHHPVLRALYAVSPALGRAVRRVVRPAAYLAAITAALPAAGRIRRRLRRIGVDPGA